jgi:hypothetical protein
VNFYAGVGAVFDQLLTQTQQLLGPRGVKGYQMKSASMMSMVLLAMFLAAVGTMYAIKSVNIGGLLPTNFVAAQVINQRCPLHIVRPEWIAGTDQTDILLKWPAAEEKARVALLLFVWILGAGCLCSLVDRKATA